MKRKLNYSSTPAKNGQRWKLRKSQSSETKDSWSLKSIASMTQEITSALFKVGTLILAVVILFWLFRAVSKEGYTIEPFNVPKHLTDSGYNGAIIARKIQDEVQFLKEEAQSVKADSLRLIGNDNPDLNVSLLSVGFSLNSLTYHLRDLLGRKNNTIRGEITQLSDTYSLTVRMTDYPLLEYDIPIQNNNTEVAIDQLIRKGGEAILLNTDPYRFAVVCYKNKRFRDGMTAVQKAIKHHPNDAHWAYLAWGSILLQQDNHHSAITKFKEATKIKPDFELPWVKLAWSYRHIGNEKAAAAAMRKSVALTPNNINRLHSAAWFFHMDEQYEMADSLFAQAVKVDPRNPYVWSTWADSKTGRNQYEEALALIEKSEPYVGNNASGLLLKAFGSFLRQDTLQALDYANAAFELEPNYSAAASNVIRGYLYLKDYDKILEIADQADWENMHTDLFQKQSALNMWAIACNQTGQYDAAYSIVQDAIEIEKHNPVPYTTLAETFAFRNQRDSFYYYLDVAFQKGLEVKWMTEEFKKPPYDIVSQEQRFKDLIEKYREEKMLKG